MKTKTKKNQGFTLIEMLIVVAIIGILATIVLFAVSRARKKAVASQMKAHMTEMMKAVEMAAIDNCPYLYFDAGGGNARCSSDSTKVYIARVPLSPSGSGTGSDVNRHIYHAWSNDGTTTRSYYYSINGSDAYGTLAVSPRNYYFRAYYFSGNLVFYCQNGSCYCSSNNGDACGSIN